MYLYSYTKCLNINSTKNWTVFHVPWIAINALSASEEGTTASSGRVKVGEGADGGGVATTGEGAPVLGPCSSDSGC